MRTSLEKEVIDVDQNAITLRCGVNEIKLDSSYAGQEVQSIMDTVDNILNIPDMAVVMKNSEVIDSSYIIQTGDCIEFVKPAGRKA